MVGFAGRGLLRPVGRSEGSERRVECMDGDRPQLSWKESERATRVFLKWFAVSSELFRSVAGSGRGARALGRSCRARSSRAAPRPTVPKRSLFSSVPSRCPAFFTALSAARPMATSRGPFRNSATAASDAAAWRWRALLDGHRLDAVYAQGGGEGRGDQPVVGAEPGDVVLLEAEAAALGSAGVCGVGRSEDAPSHFLEGEVVGGVALSAPGTATSRWRASSLGWVMPSARRRSRHRHTIASIWRGGYGSLPLPRFSI